MKSDNDPLKRPGFIAHPFVPPIALSIATAVALSALVISDTPMSGDARFLLDFGWVVILLIWVDTDARRLRRLPCFDFAYLVGFCLPFSLIWYCFWSRGWRGFLFLLIWGALWIAPYIAAGSLYLLLDVF